MRIRYLLALAAILIAVAPAAPASASFIEATPADVAASCTTPQWFVNPDEGDREPKRTEAGLVFTGTDLIHHDAPGGLTVDTLEPGTFVASPAPDQPSFFSVEVAGTGTPSGYATLRWDASAGTWGMTTGGNFYENADPAELVKMTDPDKATTVVRFGVGYTKAPPGSVETTVSSVTFMGKTYDLTCKPKPTATPTATPTGSATPKPTGSSSATPRPSGSSSSPAAPVAGPTLPVTGPSMGLLISLGGAVIILGAVAIAATRRRRGQTFEA
jgi:LPXTG-motif cell wall-anchored protein